MFRRIELIKEFGIQIDFDEGIFKKEFSAIKTGLMSINNCEIVESWIEKLNVPRKRISKNCRFFFTEEGWRKIGKDIVKVCKEKKQKYKVISIKEASVDQFYRDDLQVAVRPRKTRKGKAVWNE